MKAAVIGTGRMGKAILHVMAKAYPGEIGLYSRIIDMAAVVIKELQVDAMPLKESEQFSACIIIHTFWYQDVLPWVKKYEQQLKGKY